ncbi:MAG: carbohydrate binding domain-containing protein [Puniceicoccaceae bacterium]
MRGFQLLKPLLLIPLCPAINADMVPFVLPWNDDSASLTDISGWAEKPAGKNGFLYANEAGELMSGNKRARLWGVNITTGAAFPSHEDADIVAARMAKFGINVIRFHHINAPWAGTDTLIDYTQGNSRSLGAANLDKFDYFTHQLKENGIYTNLNLLVSRQFYAADGLPAEISQIGWKEGHTIGHFNDHHLDLQKEYASQLLEHVNPYTGLAYKNDPAVVTVEILNENSIFKAWFSGDMDAWPAVFQDMVDPIWNNWLADKYATTANLKSGWEFIEEPLGPELLANGDLRLGDTTGWNPERHGSAQLTAQRIADAWNGNPAYRVTVTQVGDQGWHVQPTYSPVALESGKMYTLSFAARGNNGQRLNMNISQNYNPWGGAGVGHGLNLTSDWQTVELTFISEVTDNNLRIAFNGFAQTLGYVEIAGLSLKEGGAIGELPGGSSLEALNIPWPRLSENTGGVPGEMMRDWFRFLLSREIRYIGIMEDHIRNTIGYGGLILSTQMGYAPAEALVNMTAGDAHAYWKHPIFPGSGWDPYNWYIDNESMVNSAPGTLGSLAARRVKGIPYFISEYQHGYPNTYATEAPILIGAYAALQNWDGIYFFHYGDGSDNWDKNYFNGYFDISRHPGAMANMLLGAALFRREDVQAATTVYSYPSPSEDFFTQMIGNPNGSWISAIDELGINEKISMQNRLEIDPAILNEDTGNYPPEGSGSIHISDTNELRWDESVSQKGFVEVDTPRTKALVGFVNGRSFDLGGVEVTPHANMQDWLTFGLMAMDGDGILSDDGSRCLLIATGECGNTGMQWDAGKTTLVNNNWGGAPSLAEIIPAEVFLPIKHDRVRVWSLDQTGARVEELTVDQDGTGASFSIGPASLTLWYEVEIAPKPVIDATIALALHGQAQRRTITFNITPSMDTNRVRFESSEDMDSWVDIPSTAVTWSNLGDALEARIEEDGTDPSTKVYRAIIDD